MNENDKIFNPDIDSQLQSPQFNRDAANPLSPEALIQKLQIQEAKEKEYAAKKLQEKMEELNRPLADSNYTVRTVPPSGSIIPPIKAAEELVDYKNPVTEENITTMMGAPKRGIRERIQEAELRTGRDHGALPGKALTEKSKSYLDEFGEPTFYVKNVSNGIVVICDLERTDNSSGIMGENKIARGAVVDLLAEYSMEALNKSRELRSALSSKGRNKQQLLQRLTPEEYLDEIEKEAINAEKIEKFRAMAELRAAAGETKPKKAIRPAIDAKLLQLQLSYSNEPHKGISPVEFIQWLNTEKLTLDELEYILSGVDDKDIRMFIHAKKQDLL